MSIFIKCVMTGTILILATAGSYAFGASYELTKKDLSYIDGTLESIPIDGSYSATDFNSEDVGIRTVSDAIEKYPEYHWVATRERFGGNQWGYVQQKMMDRDGKMYAMFYLRNKDDAKKLAFKLSLADNASYYANLPHGKMRRLYVTSTNINDSAYECLPDTSGFRSKIRGWWCTAYVTVDLLIGRPKEQLNQFNP